MPNTLLHSLVSLTHRLSPDEADAALLARYTAAKDSAAFAELVRRHGPAVYGVCRRMLGHVQDAEDAFQATFLVLAKHAWSVRKPNALSAWIYGTAVRVCRKAAAKRVVPQHIQFEPPCSDDPLANLAWKEIRGLLDEEMCSLPESLRLPLLLCYFNGFTRNEAAKSLGWSRRTLMRRLEKGRGRLRCRLERRGLATLGLAASVLAPQGLASTVPHHLFAAAVRVSTVGPVPAGVKALAPGLANPFLRILLGLALAIAGSGIGLAAMCSYLTANSGGISHLPVATMSGESDEPGPQEPIRKLDSDGRPLPEGAVRRLGSRRFRVEGRSDFALPTPDGKHILIHPEPSLSSYAAQGLFLMDAETGLRVRAFDQSRRVAKGQSQAAIRPAAFSPDGKKLYALGWTKLAESKPEFFVWANAENPCERAVLVWEVETGKLVEEWAFPAGKEIDPSLVGLNVSPDGKKLYVFGSIKFDRTLAGQLRAVPGIHVLDTQTGKTMQTWEGAGQPAGFTADGKDLITFRRDAPVTAFDPETGKSVRTFKLDGFVSSVALSNDGKTVAAVGLNGHPDKTTTCEIKLWDAATGREIRSLTVDAKAAQNWTARLAFAPDGKTLVLATWSGRILRWDLSNGAALPEWTGHRGAVADLLVRPGTSEFVSVGATDGAICRWDAATGKAFTKTDAYVGQVAVARTPDGKGMAAVDTAGRLELWNLETGKITKTLQSPGRGLHLLAFAPNGKELVVAAQTGPNTVWDVSSGTKVGEFEPPPKKDPKADEYYWSTLGFSPDGRHLVGGKFGRGTWAWTWPEKKLLWHEAKEWECCAFPDAETVVGSDWHDKTDARDLDSGNSKMALPFGAAHIAYSPDRRRMVSAHLDGAWRVRDAAGRALHEAKEFQVAWSVAFSPSGWLMAVAGDKSVRVYDTASWKQVAHFDGHEGTIRTVFFGADDSTLISSSAEDGTALVWSLKPPAGREPPDPAQLWDDLAGREPSVSRAVWAAAQHPDMAVKLFRAKWPVPKDPVDPARIRKLIGDLDSTQFEAREAAEAALLKMGRVAETELRKAVADTTSGEVKQRGGRILDRWSPLEVAEYSAEEARELRAVWALEIAATPEAGKLLGEWAKAKVGTRLCEEAAAARKR